MKPKIDNIEINCEWIGDFFIHNLDSENIGEVFTIEAKKRSASFWPLNKDKLELMANDHMSELTSFNYRLNDVWGEALTNLRILYTLSLEFGQTFQKLAKDPEKDILYGILLRLHAKGCQITAEVICLLSNGFADGALTRWRSLYEVLIIASFLKKYYSPDLVQRYADFSMFETVRGFDEYEKHCEKLGYDHHTDEEIEANEKLKEGLFEQYGATYLKKSYGWALPLIAGKRVTFTILEGMVDFSHWRPFYRLASHHVHAESKGLFYKLGQTEPHKVMIAGPSNSGLVDPGQSTAISFNQLTTELLLSQYAGASLKNIEPYPELIYMTSIINECSKQTVSSFVSAGKSIGDECG